MNHGVYVSQLATSVSTPVVAESGIPFVVGLAPVQVADKPAAAGTPVLCTSWAEAVEKLGYSHCRELKKEGCVPCRDCVASAAFMAFDLQE